MIFSALLGHPIEDLLKSIKKATGLLWVWGFARLWERGGTPFCLLSWEEGWQLPKILLSQV